MNFKNPTLILANSSSVAAEAIFSTPKNSSQIPKIWRYVKLLGYTF